MKITILLYKIIPILMYMIVSFSMLVWVERYYLSLIITILVYVTLVTAWNILSGFTGYLFLGAATFYGLGAYILALTIDKLTYLGSILLAGAISAGLAFLLGIPFFKIRGAYFAIATYALSMFLSNTVLFYEQKFSSIIGRWIPVQSTASIYIAVMIITFLTIIVTYLIKNSWFGYGLLAIKGDEEAAEMMGVNTRLYKNLAFSICALFMGLVGAASIARYGYVENRIAFDPLISFNTLIFALIGGAGSILGGIISASILSLVFTFAGLEERPFFFLMVLGIVIIPIFFFLPNGISGLLSLLRKWITKKVRSKI